MNAPTLAALPLALFTFPLADVELKHAVAEGTKLEITLEHTASLEITSGDVVVNGEEQPMPEGFELTVESEVSARLVDRYGPTEEGVVQSLTRTLLSFEDKLEGEAIEGGDPDGDKMSMESESPLVDVPVRWTAGKDGYEAAFADEETDLDEELLGGLTFDLSGAGLLPSGEDAGTTEWEIPAEVLVELLSFGGGFAATPEEEVDDDVLPLRPVTPLPVLGDLEGEISARLGEVDEEAGLVTVHLEGDVAGQSDVTDYVTDLAEKGDADQFREIDEFLLETEMTLEGSFVWNLEGGYLAQLEVNADFDRIMTLATGTPDVDMQFTVNFDFAGEASWLLQAAPSKD